MGHIGFFHSHCNCVLHFWETLIKFAKICDLFVRSPLLFIGLLIELFEVVGVLMILTFNFDVESSWIINEEVSEDAVDLVDRNFLVTIL